MDFKIILYFVFGILPSLTWLSYYLRKDVHPESNSMIVKIFLWGAVITLPVFFVQIGLATLLAMANVNPLATSIIYWFIVISATEEIFKYLVVRQKILNSPDLDEPLDIMLFMVIAALGFAALENILYLFSPIDQLSFNDIINRTVIISFIRFIGATFLHTLCSGMIGYYIALSICKPQKRTAYILSGFFVAIFLHGLYDFSIIMFEGPIKIITPIMILIMLACFVISSFEKLKKMKGICAIEKPYLHESMQVVK